MPIDAQGYWYPELAPKQLEIYNSPGRCILASGPKMSGKTWGNLHRLVRHAVETPRGRIGMFTKTVKNAKAGGVWNDIVELVLPEWLNAGVTKITTRKSDGTVGPKQDAQTRMMYIRLKNGYGGESEIQLHSIDNENEVESIAKGTRFSMFYFAELSNFKNRLVFDITSDQLRMPGLNFWSHLWLADTNPSDEGPDSWIYKLWYEDRVDPDSQTPALQKQLGLIEVMIQDNPYLSDEEREALLQRFSHDKDLYARYIEGKWTRATKGSLFGEVFREGGKKRERQVTQPQGMVQDEEGVDSTRDAASFLGKKLFGERLSGRVNEKGQQEEGKSGDAYDGNNGKGSDKGKKSAQDQASEAGQEGNGEQGRTLDGCPPASVPPGAGSRG